MNLTALCLSTSDFPCFMLNRYDLQWFLVHSRTLRTETVDSSVDETDCAEFRISEHAISYRLRAAESDYEQYLKECGTWTGFRPISPQCVPPRAACRASRRGYPGQSEMCCMNRTS